MWVDTFDFALLSRTDKLLFIFIYQRRVERSGGAKSEKKEKELFFFCGLYNDSEVARLQCTVPGGQSLKWLMLSTWKILLIAAKETQQQELTRQCQPAWLWKWSGLCWCHLWKRHQPNRSLSCWLARSLPQWSWTSLSAAPGQRSGITLERWVMGVDKETSWEKFRGILISVFYSVHKRKTLSYHEKVFDALVREFFFSDKSTLRCIAKVSWKRFFLRLQVECTGSCDQFTSSENAALRLDGRGDTSNQIEKYNNHSSPQSSSMWGLAGRDFTRITTCAHHTIQWYHNCRNFNNFAFILWKTVKETQLVTQCF